MFIQSIAMIKDIASGFNSGYSTCNNFAKTKKYEGFTTWAQVTWQGSKTALKAYRLQASSMLFSQTVSKGAILVTFGLWSGLYGLSSIFAYKGDAGYGCGAMYEPNKIVEYAPHLLVATRIALTAIECATNPRKAITSFVAMTLAVVDTTALLGKELSYGVHTVLPTAAKVTMFVLGGPITKVIIGCELVASTIFSSGR